MRMEVTHNLKKEVTESTDAGKAGTKTLKF